MDETSHDDQQIQVSLYYTGKGMPGENVIESVIHGNLSKQINLTTRARQGNLLATQQPICPLKPYEQSLNHAFNVNTEREHALTWKAK